MPSSSSVALPTQPEDERHSQSRPRSPYRYVVARQVDEKDEKDAARNSAELARLPSTASCSRAAGRSSSHRPYTPTTPSDLQHSYGYPCPSRTPLPPPCTQADPVPASCWSRLWYHFKPWIPISLWVATSLGFLLAIAFWRTEVFQRLDDFSHWLQAQGWYGYTLLGILIFVTTIPPFPLYSTFMTLSGYCFGAWPGAVISYVASLSGAIVVFLLSRAYLSEYIGSFFQRSPSFKRVVRAIERRPNVLFLVRLAPYPYNVMNVLLAASPTLTLRTYTVCTGLALFKVIIHTTIGASIHSFSHQVAGIPTPSTGGNPETPDAGDEDDNGENSTLSKALQIGGIALCVGVFIYISWVARRAVNHEADDEDECRDSDERVAFLSDNGRDTSIESTQEMSETSLNAGHRSMARMDNTAEDNNLIVPNSTSSPKPPRGSSSQP